MLNLEQLSHISLYDMLAESALHHPNHLAVIDGSMEFTYSDLKNSVDAFSSKLHKLGFQKGDRVGLMLPNCIHYIVSYYAALRLGGTVVQVNPLYQSSELEYILGDSHLTWFICEQIQREKIQRVQTFDQVHVLFTKSDENLDQILVNETAENLPSVVVKPKDDVAVIQYTGGTTGKSKGVMLTHFNILGNLRQASEVFSSVIEIGKERVLGMSPLTHAMAMSNMNFTIYYAAAYIILDKFNPLKVLKAISKYRPTYMVGSPTMYIALLNQPELSEYDLSCFKICLSGSAPLPIEVIKELERKTGAKILEGYGLSEATTSTHRTPIEGKRKIGSVGLPVPLTEAKIVDLETGKQEVPVGSNGELIIKGPQVMKGYWNKPEETAHSIRDGWLFTGDIAQMDQDGFYYIVGRKKDMVIAGGLNIYPAEVEELLYQHPSVAEACVFGVPDSYLGEKAVAVIILKSGESVSEQDILSWCEGKIAKYKIPRSIEFRNTLPKTIVGKILRRKLVDEYQEKINTEEVHVRQKKIRN